MACPLFSPDGLLDDPLFAQARTPLGGIYAGVCHATAEPQHPDQSQIRQVCNFGYARGRCSRFPSSQPDAVRFSITSHEGGRIRLVYVYELTCAPVEHGVLEYLPDQARLEGTAEAVLRAQALAFLKSYLERM